MLNSSDRLFKYFRDFPALAGALAQYKPVFRIITWPILGNLLARCISVRSAARLASISAAELSAFVSRTIGENAGCLGRDGRVPGEKIRGKKMWSSQEFFQGKTEVVLDVRPIFSRGIDPFQDIMTALGKLRHDQYLTLVNSFEPIPLYTKLKEKGFVFQTSQKGSFYYIKITRNGKSEKKDTSNTESGFLDFPENELIRIENELSQKNPGSLAFIDVSELPAPEPLMKIADVMAKNPAPLMVKVSHRKLPHHLPGFFKGKPYQVSAFERKDGEVIIYIVHKTLLEKK